MTSSSGDEAPRGLEFLYSLNRFNEFAPRPLQHATAHLKLANALCAYLERAVTITAGFT
jgi:hypothetical protein